MGEHRRKADGRCVASTEFKRESPRQQSRKAHAKIREFERTLGRKTIDVEILRTAREMVIAADAG